MDESPPREDPRVTRSRSAILTAALSELTERGYGAFTIDGVATRSGVARSTVYRLWPDRPTLIADAVCTLNRQPAPEAGTSLDDIVSLMRHLDQAMNDSPLARCLPALIDGAARDDVLRELHQADSAQRRQRLVEAIRAGVEAGEIAPTEPELAATALAGAVLYHRLLTPRRLTSAELDLLVDVVLRRVPHGAISSNEAYRSSVQ